MKRQLRYGANVEWFLNDIAAVEMSDIDSGEFEIYGEDEAGREACTYIDITELAADAAQMIGELRDQLHAAEHLAELRGRQNLDTQRKLDALAAENAALKEFANNQYCAVEHWNGWADDEDRLATELPTPATDAYLNSVRADELGKVAVLINLSADKKRSEGYDDCARDRRDLAVHFLTMAHQLRAGKDGENDR
ncbi:hypothetical protein ACKVM9_002871 [Pantoea agglomerans]|jgi:hypothetical protein|uniref:hypothetical protein n=1 Tax=Enterobacter agglomerans TaxID=549 RepID=UPI003908DA56